MPIKPLSQTDSFLPLNTVPDWLLRIDVLRSLRLHKRLAIIIALVTLALGSAFYARHRPTYDATSVVYVSPNFPATFSTSQEQEYPYDSFIEEQVHSVAGFNVLADALRGLAPGVWQFPGETLESAVDRLQKSLVVKRDGLSYQVMISLQDKDPTHLAEIVNAVTDSYLNGTRSEEFYGRDKRLEALRQERAAVQSELNAKLQEQTRISQSLGMAQISTVGGDQIDLQVAKLRTDLTVAHEQRIQAEAQLSALENGNKNAPNAALDAAADEIIATDPSVLSLKASLSQKRALLLDQLAGLTASHPLRKNTEEQLAEIERALQQMQSNLRGRAITNLQQKLRTDLLRASTIESKLLSDLEANTRQATQAAPSYQRSLVLKAAITALQGRYEALDERTRNLELESKSPGSVHLFSAARQPTGPLSSIMRFFLPALVPFALILAIAGVVAIDLLDRHIYTFTDIEQVMGFAPIGSLFDNRDVSMQIFDEGILRTAGGLDHAARTSSVRTIVVTAVNPGAGTTSIVEDLGSTLAKLGRKTLTIDSSGISSAKAYVTHQSGHHALGGMPVKKQDADVRSTVVIAQPFSSKLKPLTNLMDQAFKDLTVDYDMVLIDATPILISAETEYLARFADVTMLVAEAGKTTRSELVRATRLLERLQIPGMAIVLNKMSYSRVNRATRNDVSAFESRAEGSVKWSPSRSMASAPAGFEATSQAAKETSTYA